MFRTSATRASARAVCIAVTTAAVCGTAHAQVSDLEAKKYRPNHEPVKSISDASLPTAEQAEQWKGDYISVGLPPQNDECSGAIDVGSLPTVVSGSTLDATVDGVAFCGTSELRAGRLVHRPGHGQHARRHNVLLRRLRRLRHQAQRLLWKLRRAGLRHRQRRYLRRSVRGQLVLGAGADLLHPRPRVQRQHRRLQSRGRRHRSRVQQSDRVRAVRCRVRVHRHPRG